MNKWCYTMDIKRLQTAIIAEKYFGDKFTINEDGSIDGHEFLMHSTEPAKM